MGSALGGNIATQRRQRDCRQRIFDNKMRKILNEDIQERTGEVGPHKALRETGSFIGNRGFDSRSSEARNIR